MKSILKNNKGSILIEYIIIYPFLITFFLYLVLAGAFFMSHNEMTNITNLKMDRALVEGQFTPELLEGLTDSLTESGFNENSLQIQITPNEAQDTDTNTYVPRGQEIELIVIHAEPPPFYWINKLFIWDLSEEKFYIGTKINGMSELW
ncbi:hypothetical protein M1146_05605 [Patescibacteria group bacterium]|nr:hypothetical protein [Patescibacteria group bacterium]